MTVTGPAPLARGLECPETENSTSTNQERVWRNVHYVQTVPR